MRYCAWTLTLVSLLGIFPTGSAQHCGSPAGGALCPGGICCSQFGFCGTTPDYCGPGCQSQCGGGEPSWPQCGVQAGGALCPGGLCCSQWGYCGTTPEFCGDATCQIQCGGNPTTQGPLVGPSNCTGGPMLPLADVSEVISNATFNKMLLHRNDATCHAKGFYTYNAFVKAAKSFPTFATTGDITTRKREIAAFFAQMFHKTTADGPCSWGNCYKKEQGNPPAYCFPTPQWPCAPGKKYYGRGPIQISYNYNYGLAGQAINMDLINNPDLVETDPTISFLTAIWFWMTPQSPKPSCHDVITGKWTLSPAVRTAGRVRRFGVITNIINGGLECGHDSYARVQNRIKFYKRFCQMLGVRPGEHLNYGNQKPFGSELSVGYI